METRSQYKIEKVPLPEKRVNRYADHLNNKKYPFDKLAVGESFYLPGKRRQQIAQSIRHWQYTLGWRYTTRKDSEGIRIFRVE